MPTSIVSHTVGSGREFGIISTLHSGKGAHERLVCHVTCRDIRVGTDDGLDTLVELGAGKTTLIGLGLL